MALYLDPMALSSETQQARGSKAALYEELEGICFRAPVLPIAKCQETPYAADLDLKDPLLRYALTIASPSLVTALDGARAARDTAKVAALRGKLLRYVIRMRTRPTPFGLFAGVATARWGDRTDLTLAGIRRVGIRPDMEWLTYLIRKLETRPVIRRSLVWMATPASFAWGGRVYLEDRTPENQPGGSVRATAAVTRALDAARQPIPYSTLLDQLTSSAGLGDRAQVERLLDRLWKHGFMYTNLMPSPNASDPLQHVIQKLSPIPQAKTVCLRLEALAEAIRRCEATSPTHALELHQYAAAQAKLIADAGPANPLQVDCSLSYVGNQIHRAVARRTALAAEVLLRLGGLPKGPRQITQYRQAFLARYGRHREVPLLELMSPDWGLGPLGAVTQTTPVLDGAAADKRMRRTDAIEKLVLRAVHERKLRVVLDDAMLAQLEHGQFDANRAPSSLDLHVHVIAENPQAIDEARFLIAIAPSVGAMGAGRYWGRFTNLFGQELSALFRRVADHEKHWSTENIVDLNYLPTQPRAANISVCPAIREYQTTLGLVSDGDAKTSIPLNEIMVSVRDDRFLMRWSRENFFIRFCVGHMLNVNLAPHVIQFLLEASQDGVAQLGPFDWGSYGTYPVLPRLEYGGIVLSPARWRLKAPGDDGIVKVEDIRRHITAWRSSWNVPREVYLSAGDNRLLLDLDASDQLGELIQEIRKLKPHETCLVEEALPGTAHAWVDGPNGSYMSDLVVSLIKRHSGLAATLEPACDFPCPREERLKVPGEEWAYLKVYVPSRIQNEILCGPVRDFVATVAKCPQIQKWFFIRYADPEPHLRLRFRGPKDWLNRDWLPDLLSWGKSLIDRGFCDRIAVDTYSREIERYGGLASIDLVETLFHVDSLSVLDLLNQAAMSVPSLDMPALAIATLDDFYNALAPDAVTAVQWLRRVAASSRKVAGEDYRNNKATLLAYVGERCVGDPHLGGILQHRRNEVTRLGKELRALEDAATLSVPMENLCASLAHMHLNRLFPLRDFDEGKLLGLLARVRESLLHL